MNEEYHWQLYNNKFDLTFRKKLLKVLVQERKLKETKAHKTKMIITTPYPLSNPQKLQAQVVLKVFHQTYRAS